MKQSEIFPEKCTDCTGCITKTLNFSGIHKQRSHCCGCRDWTYTNEKNTWYRLKWCDYHYKEREAQITESKKVEA